MSSFGKYEWFLSGIQEDLRHKHIQSSAIYFASGFCLIWPMRIWMGNLELSTGHVDSFFFQ